MACGVRVITKRTLTDGNTLLDFPHIHSLSNFVCTQHAHKNWTGFRRMWLSYETGAHEFLCTFKPLTRVTTDLVQTDISVHRIGIGFHPITAPEIYDSTKLFWEPIMVYVASFMLLVSSIHNRHIKNPGPLPPRTLQLRSHLPHTTNTIPKITSIYYTKKR
jgi:hypothetical protein